MRKGLAAIAVSLSVSACTATTDEQYMQCLQGFNDSGSAISVVAERPLGPGRYATSLRVIRSVNQ